MIYPPGLLRKQSVICPSRYLMQIYDASKSKQTVPFTPGLCILNRARFSHQIQDNHSIKSYLSIYVSYTFPATMSPG